VQRRCMHERRCGFVLNINSNFRVCVSLSVFRSLRSLLLRRPSMGHSLYEWSYRPLSCSPNVRSFLCLDTGVAYAPFDTGAIGFGKQLGFQALCSTVCGVVLFFFVLLCLFCYFMWGWWRGGSREGSAVEVREADFKRFVALGTSAAR
jgi:hypothetical protein